MRVREEPPRQGRYGSVSPRDRRGSLHPRDLEPSPRAPALAKGPNPNLVAPRGRRSEFDQWIQPSTWRVVIAAEHPAGRPHHESEVAVRVGKYAEVGRGVGVGQHSVREAVDVPHARRRPDGRGRHRTARGQIQDARVGDEAPLQDRRGSLYLRDLEPSLRAPTLAIGPNPNLVAPRDRRSEFDQWIDPSKSRVVIAAEHSAGRPHHESEVAVRVGKYAEVGRGVGVGQHSVREAVDVPHAPRRADGRGRHRTARGQVQEVRVGDEPPRQSRLGNLDFRNLGGDRSGESVPLAGENRSGESVALNGENRWGESVALTSRIRGSIDVGATGQPVGRIASVGPAAYDPGLSGVWRWSRVADENGTHFIVSDERRDGRPSQRCGFLDLNRHVGVR